MSGHGDKAVHRLAPPIIHVHNDRAVAEVSRVVEGPKSWGGTRPVPLAPRALEIFRAHVGGKKSEDYLFTDQLDGQLSVGVVRKFPLGFRRHALRHYAASTWLCLGAPVHEVAEYLGNEACTVLVVYARGLGEGQRRDHLRRLAAAEDFGHHGDALGAPEAARASNAGRTRRWKGKKI
jgi:hypothetical protein